MEQSASMEIQIETASTNNKDQNTQKEADISGGNENKNEGLIIEIREIVERLEIQSSEQCRIFKTPHPLRKLNEEAYTPQVISIGPLHHRNEGLKAMEKHKERYFKSFVKRSNIKLEYLVGTVREMEENIRGCYEETIDHDLPSDRFVKMILVDACFILELLFRHSSKGLTGDDPMAVEPRATAVMFDLLLFENQLPFFVIKKLHDLAFPSLSALLFEYIFSYFTKYTDFPFRQFNPNVEIEHFTDLLRTLMLPPLEQRPKRAIQKTNLLYSATQLQEAGVKFKHVKSERSFEIKFEKGVLKIPRLDLMDWTEVVTRNIMALEQTRYMEDLYFTDYFIFMDDLINSREDVDLLCEKKIWANYLGDSNAAMSMINNLNKGIVWGTVRVDYIKLRNDLNSFYENPWHSWKATLKRDYFSTPWIIASTTAAVILLVLTFIQTTCSIFKNG